MQPESVEPLVSAGAAGAVDEDGMVGVRLPSGATFPVHAEEVDYLIERAKRYLDENHFCLPAGTAVSSLDGPVAVECVTPGTDVWVVRDDAVAPGVVTAVHEVAAQPVVVLHTRNRTLRCSPGHKVLVWTTSPPSSKRVGNRGRLPNEYYLAWTEAGTVEVGDRIVIHEETSPEGSEECPTRWVSEGFAEFCGLFTGDGLTVNHGYVRICRAVDASYMDHYRQIIRDEFVRADGSSVQLCEMAYTQFGSVAAAQELEALGLCGGSLGKRVPAWVFRLDGKRRAAYLRGYVDADGSIDKAGRIQFNSPNVALIRDFWHLCIGLGLPVTNLHTAHITKTNYSTNSFSVYGFVATDAFLNAERVGTNDLHDQLRWAKARPSRRSRYLDRHGRGLTPPVGCGFARVTSVTEQPPEKMYDLTVDDGHTFIADGVVTHNSNISDFQDVDRMLFTEVMCFRWGVWISRQKDYWGDSVDVDQLQASLKHHSMELRQIKKQLGIDKLQRDKAKGEDSTPAYINNLLSRAKEFGVHREMQTAKALELFNQLKALVTLHLNADEVEREELHMHIEDILEWLTTIAFPEFDALDEHFRANQQRYWVKSL